MKQRLFHGARDMEIYHQLRPSFLRQHPRGDEVIDLRHSRKLASSAAATQARCSVPCPICQ